MPSDDDIIRPRVVSSTPPPMRHESSKQLRKQVESHWTHLIELIKSKLWFSALLWVIFVYVTQPWKRALNMKEHSHGTLTAIKNSEEWGVMRVQRTAKREKNHRRMKLIKQCNLWHVLLLSCVRRGKLVHSNIAAVASLRNKVDVYIR